MLFEAKVSILRNEPDVIHNKSYAELELIGTGMIIGERMEVLLEKKNTPQSVGIIIPSDAIITKYGETGVYILENGRSRYAIVTIVASDENTSAVTGLSAGQKIITRGKENVFDGEVLE